MTSISKPRFSRLLLYLLLQTCMIGAIPDAVRSAERGKWVVEQGTDRPSYAAAAPTSTNLNVDMVVLACEEAWGSRLLQLQLYLTDAGPLQPNYPRLRPFKNEPRATISIDRVAFPAAVLFADDYVVLADAREGAFPLLSDGLMAAMQTGNSMTLHFDLLEEWPGQAASFDGEVVVDLQAPGGREAIATMRKCANPAAEVQAHAFLVDL